MIAYRKPFAFTLASASGKGVLRKQLLCDLSVYIQLSYPAVFKGICIDLCDVIRKRYGLKLLSLERPLSDLGYCKGFLTQPRTVRLFINVFKLERGTVPSFPTGSARSSL